MKFLLSLFSLMIVIFSITSCSTNAKNNPDREKAISEVKSVFSPAAITLQVTADSGLNAWNDISNSCTLLIIQSADKQSLQNIMSDVSLIKRLYNNGGTSEGILKLDKYTAMPGLKSTIHIDRSERTRYVGVIAGYFPFPGSQHMLTFDIPVKVSAEGWFNKTWSASLAPLNKNIFLGKDSVKSI